MNLHNPLNQSSLFFRKDKLINYLFNESLDYYEDFELFFRLSDKLKFYILPDYLTYTRLRKDSKGLSAEGKHIMKMFSESKNGIENKDINGWRNYFYGDKKTARRLLSKKISLKNIAGILTTFLPDSYFRKFTGSRMKFRFQSFFKKKKMYENELQRLLNAE